MAWSAASVPRTVRGAQEGDQAIRFTTGQPRIGPLTGFRRFLLAYAPLGAEADGICVSGGNA
jgi:hypothetical protein